MMCISHECNTPDPLINRGGRAITRRAPYPKGMDRGNVLEGRGITGITPGPGQGLGNMLPIDCYYITIVYKNVVGIVLFP